MYTPLATKYRPQRFADVVGQDFAVKVLTKAIQKNRIGAALLFSGTRGVGKTTLARVLSKALRCENRQDSEFEPCCKCESCRSFSKDNQIDVIEIDAASNTGVDDVREIIESCRYKPTTGKYKIFIIDEVHMLSKSAFNALLKTLEEPPEYVKFLLATTETYKIPETILSRVLRFDLKNVEHDVIVQYLSSVCNQEKISADLSVLSLIARAASGSIRDSLSILDQAINVADDGRLTLKNVQEMLSVSNDGDLTDLFELITSSKLQDAVLRYRQLSDKGTSAQTIVSRFMDYVHLLSCLKVGVTPFEQIVDEHVQARFQSLADKISISALSVLWQMLIKCTDELKLCDKAASVFEMMIIRLAHASEFPDLREIVKKFDQSPTVANTSEFKQSEDSLLSEALKVFPNAIVKN